MNIQLLKENSSTLNLHQQYLLVVVHHTVVLCHTVVKILTYFNRNNKKGLTLENMIYRNACPSLIQKSKNLPKHISKRFVLKFILALKIHIFFNLAQTYLAIPS
jgi:hypothetical protein